MTPDGALIDATGAKIDISRVPTRIVTLAPSLGELAAEILGPDLGVIAGVSEYTDFPPALSSKPSVGPFHRINVERVVALKPDLVLATLDGNPRDRVLQLRELGLRVIVVDTSTLDSVARSFLWVGHALGRTREGEGLARRLTEGLTALKARAAGRAHSGVPRPTVLLQLDRQPLVAVGGDTFLNQALEVVGARNSLEDLRTRYPRPAIEEVIRRDPDWIVVLAMAGSPDAAFAKMAEDWKALKNLKAVSRSQVRILKADGLARPSVRLLEGLALLEKLLYGGPK
ncbi:MAG TPA: helical backbone metal receptor [Bdellovibrionota bacterium]|nr:helical backbone metal receptor [Bdellovibrionota bacterium]